MPGMTPFRNAQCVDPLDPAPMLIWADHLEESGDRAAADALRGLASAGIPSLHALAIGVVSASVTIMPDASKAEEASGYGYRDGAGQGHGLGYRVGMGAGYADGARPGPKHGDGDGLREDAE